MPLSLIARMPGGTFGSRCSLTARSVTSVRRSRLLMPMNVAPSATARRSSSSSWASTSTSSEYARASSIHSRDRRVVHAAHDQQHAVGTVRGRLRDLITRPEKILAQERAGRDRANGVEIAELAEEMIALGQHADRVGAGRFVDSRDRQRIEVARDQAGRRRRALDLGDDRRAARAAQRRYERTALADPRAARVRAAPRRVRASAPLRAAPLWRRRSFAGC